MATHVSTQPGSSTARPAAEAPFARLLVPVDFSLAARAAVAMAVRLAESFGSQVVLFHAAGPDANDEFLDATGVPWGKSDVLGESSDHLRRFAETVVPGAAARVPVQVEATKADDPVGAVLAACERWQPSLVVLGVRERDRRAWRRTRAERIARSLACPVLLVPGEPEPPDVQD